MFLGVYGILTLIFSLPLCRAVRDISPRGAILTTAGSYA